MLLWRHLRRLQVSCGPSGIGKQLNFACASLKGKGITTREGAHSSHPLGWKVPMEKGGVKGEQLETNGSPGASVDATLKTSLSPGSREDKASRQMLALADGSPSALSSSCLEISKLKTEKVIKLGFN
ncbi:hypothetical protein mRhiFer1_009571 [Rhinolophus ferrumequinum]|uniref:Uncharacterized protein n=1 Tax=Rhinolophus ferrumequinum TaxID=59479 RepID=A0A7J7ZQH7_RHIFE|nr:hypothetical protein mRhiFer1_009571 [Rhinolophus ferrumequinum]